MDDQKTRLGLNEIIPTAEAQLNVADVDGRQDGLGESWSVIEDGNSKEQGTCEECGDARENVDDEEEDEKYHGSWKEFYAGP